MNRTLLLPVVVLLAAGVNLCRAEEPNLKTVAPEELINQLGGNDFVRREQAAKELQARGPAVLPALRKAAQHKDREVRRQVADLILTLEAIEVVAPKRVTLAAAKQPLSAILKDIEKQTSYLVEEEERNDDKRYTFEMKDVPFWEALERIRRETGCVLDRGDNHALRLKQSKTSSPFVVSDGSFRLELKRFHENRDFNYSEPSEDQDGELRDNLITFTVSVLAEPKFRLLGVEKACVDAAVDEDNKSLAFSLRPADRKCNQLRAQDNLSLPYHQPAEILLRRSTNTAQTIKELRGTITAHVVVARKPLVVSENVLEARMSECKVGDKTLKISVYQDKDTEGTFTVSLEVPPEAVNIPSHWHERFHVEDEKGNRYRSWAGGSSQIGERTSVFNIYHKPDNTEIGPPKKLIIEDWTVRHHSIPFVFKNVPLP
jgi:hypothetical protein